MKMAANISTNQNGETNFVAFGKPAWWGGQSFPIEQKTNLFDALKLAKGDFQLTCEPQIAVVNGNYVENPDKDLLVRHPVEGSNETEYVVLGEVSKHYKEVLIQNVELVNYFNAISETWPVATVGFLGKGETIFFALHGGEYEIIQPNGKKDLVKDYLSLVDNKTGEMNTGIYITPMRFECANTVTMGIKQARLSFKVPHFTGNKQKLLDIVSVTEQLQEQTKEIHTIFGTMAGTPFSLERFKELVDKILYPAPEEFAEEYSVGFRTNSQSRLYGLFGNYTEKFGGETLYGALQAITEFEDHPDKVRGDSWKNSTLFGNRANAKKVAFAELVKNVK
jgi:hypothetical protein